MPKYYTTPANIECIRRILAGDTRKASVFWLASKRAEMHFPHWSQSDRTKDTPNG